MAISDVAGEWVYHVSDILREFLGHNSVSGFRTLKPKNLTTLKNLKNLKKLYKNLKKIKT